jgi:hypothetical protein
VRCFTCRLPSPVVSPDAAEIDEVAWFAWDDLPREALAGTSVVIDRARPFAASTGT